jgi:Flp pilus assembly protein TadD
VLRRRAQIASQRKDTAAALAFLHEATEIAPKDPWPRLEAAGLLLAQSDFAAAAEKAGEAVALSDAPIAAVLKRAAAIEERCGQLDAAREHAQQAIAADPKDPQPWSILANILSVAGDLAGAREAAEKAIQVASGGKEASAQALLLERA